MYAELHSTSNFSFLRGASHPEELVIMAKIKGLSALAITDRNSMAGIVRAHKAAKENDLPFIPACRLDLMDAPSLLAYPTDRDAYARLTELLTIGNRRAPKGECHLGLEDVASFSKGLMFALVPDAKTPGDILSETHINKLQRMREQLNAPLYLAAHYTYQGEDKRRIHALATCAQQAGLPLLATGDVMFHGPERRVLADVVTCIREHKRIEEAGYLLAANAERFIKPAHEMQRLFAEYPRAVKNTQVIQEACNFSLDELSYNYPHEPVPEGKTPQQHLAELSYKGAEDRFPEGMPDKVRDILQRELELVDELGYAPYFLTVHDIVHFARSRKILCQGRGSAANSVICYMLRITDVNPAKVDLLFERFVSKERGEPPDIDVDFEHERREEVIQYIYERYGRHRAGLAATLITYRARSAIREVGKVMGLSEDMISALSGTVWGFYSSEIPDEQVRQAGFDPAEPGLMQTLAIAHEIVGFPRHLSQHVGGFVLTESPLHHIVPIQNAAMKDRTVIEWNKDDLDTLNILKVDVLALGMLSCLRKAFDLMRMHHGRNYELATLPNEDPATYAMLQRADSVGVFQVESRAQMSMLPRLKPKSYYDLVVQVAIVRPGPIQGDMVHPYLRRRQGKEAVEYPAPDPAFGPTDELEQVLSRTYGVPLFQEQAMKIAIVAAGFTPGEADGLRRAMATFRNSGTVGAFEAKFINGMTDRGYTQDFAERCFRQIEGFADYGFPESHAASFALLVYASSWVKCHHPDVFACALLNAQPMGFYAPAQIVRDAREHGVEVRPVDVNHSDWDCTLEPAPKTKWGCAVRLGMRQVKGVREDAAELLMAARLRPFTDAFDVHARTRMMVVQLEKLAEADAFRSCGLDRRQALWQVRGLVDTPDLPLFAHADTEETGPEVEAVLPTMPLAEHVVNDYQTLRLSLKAHPLSFLRTTMKARGVVPCRGLEEKRDGDHASVAGLVLVRQRPGSAKGVIFLTLEDETGVANIVVWSKVFDAHRAILMGGRLLVVEGQLQREDGVTHLVARKLYDASAELLRLSDDVDDLSVPVAAADEVKKPTEGDRRLPPFKASMHPRNVRGLIPKSRDFH
ncbi:MAG: error-prone DNA polymerase [Kordiimonadaceae bacterium]|nr:error-prone DNA polymerase [Kordiimonadaceae bacterium]MBO6567350.1 error-prone DNA polymerase [Kordiimonadaceae bacterium]MBO6963436.1 error-prone DNA polymerase [Kordiimonadaceae bacterium]